MSRDNFRQTLNILLAVVATIGLLTLFYLVVAEPLPVEQSSDSRDFIKKNYKAVLGVPFAAIASFAVIALLRQNDLPIKVEGLGFRFEGPAGEIILWILVYGAIIGGVWLLSDDGY